ncbi:YacL family protein [Candidatus Poribacteria bacterium]|nr:YacL family protein [Candidatus Poribacteria bacterium]
MVVKCYIDPSGIRRAEVSPPYELVGWYLMDDVQGGIYSCKELLSIIEKVKTGVESEYSGTGNAHTITITKDKVVIENEYLIESEDCDISRICEIPLFEFEKALTQWFELIKVGQEELLKWVEAELKKDDDEIARIRERRLHRKLIESKKKNARKWLKG